MIKSVTRTAMLTVGALVAVPLVASPAGVGHAAYNVGVKSVHIAVVDDTCLPDNALPCTPGAGQGDANVLRVSQNEVNGYHQFNELSGTSVDPGRMWIGAEISGECKAAHHLVRAVIDGDVSHGDFDGLVNMSGFGDGSNPWPYVLDGLDGRKLHTRRVALDVPISSAFADGMIGNSATEQNVFDVGEAVISSRIHEEGMTPAEARALPFTRHTTVTIAASLYCEYNGFIIAAYEKRRLVTYPMTIEYLPADVAAPVGDSAPASNDLHVAPQVVDAALAVIADPEDPCQLFLSGTIQTNQPMTVDYRFVDPFGHLLNVHSVEVDQTLTAFVSRPVDVPMAPGPDPIDEFAPIPGQGIGDNYAVEGDSSQYTGTYTIETLAPNHESAADGFSVPYCDTPKVERNPDIGDGPGELTGGADPTHSDPMTGTLVPPVPSVVAPSVVAPSVVAPPAVQAPVVTPTAPPIRRSR